MTPLDIYKVSYENIKRCELFLDDSGLIMMHVHPDDSSIWKFSGRNVIDRFYFCVWGLSHNDVLV